MIKVSAAEARNAFAEITDRVRIEKERVMVTRNGRPYVAIMPVEDLEEIEAAEDRVDIAEAERILADPKSEFIPWKRAKKELGLK